MFMMRSRNWLYTQHNITEGRYNINTRLYNTIVVIYSLCTFVNKNHSKIRRRRALDVSHQNVGGGSSPVRTCYYNILWCRTADMYIKLYNNMYISSNANSVVTSMTRRDHGLVFVHARHPLGKGAGFSPVECVCL